LVFILGISISVVSGTTRHATLAGVAGKRHGMIKRTPKFVRDATGTMLLSDSDAKIVKKYMPYDR